MDALFGALGTEKLRSRLGHLKPIERERAIIEEVAEAFKELDGRFFLSFRFWRETKRRIGHHLLFVSKIFTGYHVVKDIMARESSSAPQGASSFEYDPTDYSLQFELSRPLDELEGQLLNDFAGRTLAMPEIYQEHSPSRPYQLPAQ